MKFHNWELKDIIEDTLDGIPEWKLMSKKALAIELAEAIESWIDKDDEVEEREEV